MLGHYVFLFLLVATCGVGLRWALSPLTVEVCIGCDADEAVHPAADGGPGGLCDACHELEVRS